MTTALQERSTAVGIQDLIALRNGFVLIPDGSEDNVIVAASLQAELMQLGFLLDAQAFAAASTAPRAWLVALYEFLVPTLQSQLGADRSYTPFYRNFPRQVMETSHLELFLNAIVHYLSNGRWEPAQEVAERGVRFEKTDFTQLRRGTEADMLAVFTRLVSLPQALTEADQETVRWFVQTYGTALPMPAVIPFKETLCLLAASGLDVPITSPTDVLRIAVALSGGDVSLPAVPKPTTKVEQFMLLYGSRRRAAA